MFRTYKVEFETDSEGNRICVSLPTLNHTADFGDTVEEALNNLHKLASVVIEYWQDEGRELPPSDEPEDGGISLSFELEAKLLDEPAKAAKVGV